MKALATTAREATPLAPSEPEVMLKNAQIQYREEADEIAIYKTIQAFAEKVGDKDTAKLAKSILREEERMAKYVEGQIKQLSGSVVQAVVPRDQRSGTTRRPRKSSSARKSQRQQQPSSSTSRSKASGSSRKSTAKRKASGSSSRASARGKSSSARKSTASKSTAKKSSGARKPSGASTRKSGARKSGGSTRRRRSRSPRAAVSQYRRPGPRGPGAF